MSNQPAGQKPAHLLTSIADLEALYGAPGDAALVKESSVLTPQYKALLEASPFCTIATAGPDGLDCSPRGDAGCCVHVADDKTILIPDRRGNNRVDTLKNIVSDPRVALLFLIPGSGTTLRINGRAVISVDPELLQSLAVDGKAPRSVIVITIDIVFFQCARAVVRAKLWDPAEHRDLSALPTAGEILATQSNDRVGGVAYDREWPERAKSSLW